MVMIHYSKVSFLFQVSDASRSEREIDEAEARGDKMVRVNQEIRLDNRFLDIRV